MSTKSVVKTCDMPDTMLQAALGEAEYAFGTYNTEKEVAQSVRNAFVKKYNGVWHCFVGRNFGAYYIHEANHHVYFYMGQMAVLLFKTG